MHKKESPFKGRKIAFFILLGVFATSTIICAFLKPIHIIFLIGAILSPMAFTGIAVGGPFWAFEFELRKKDLERQLYLKQDTRRIEEEYRTLNADIHHRARKKFARSFREGISHERCPKCGDEIESNESFCTHCGTQLEKICPKCKNINSFTDNFCKNCGKKL